MNVNSVTDDAAGVRSRLLKVGALTVAALGAIATIALVAVAIHYGTASFPCLVAVVPYVLVVLCTMRSRSAAVTVGFFFLACGLTVVGNLFYFDAVVLRPSGGTANAFWQGASVEMFVVCVFFWVARHRQASPDRRST